jgi:DNA segregation ATPase FtsK/SpoIIIE-like protein
VELVISQKQASVSFVQRRLGLRYPKAARFIALMEQDRIIGPGDGAIRQTSSAPSTRPAAPRSGLQGVSEDPGIDRVRRAGAGLHRPR